MIGLPHPDFGEAVMRWWLPRWRRAVGAAIVAALKAQLANFKVPKRVFVVPDLPRNTMGKVQKNLLRQRYGG